MECRKLKITLVSAENLPEARSSGTMNLYAEVSLNGEPKTTVQTHNVKGKSNPRWDFAIDYTIPESTVQKTGANLVVHLYRKTSVGSRSIGEVNICVKSLFEMGLKSETNGVSYHVDGTPNGSLNLSYSFGDKILVPKPSFREKLALLVLEFFGLG